MTDEICQCIYWCENKTSVIDVTTQILNKVLLMFLKTFNQNIYLGLIKNPLCRFRTKRKF